MTDEEFLRLQEAARAESRRNLFPPPMDDDDSRYERATRHAESGAAAH
ncbi:hypothetical protein [Streptomyces sp. NPDC058486]